MTYVYHPFASTTIPWGLPVHTEPLSWVYFHLKGFLLIFTAQFCLTCSAVPCKIESLLIVFWDTLIMVLLPLLLVMVFWCSHLHLGTQGLISHFEVHSIVVVIQSSTLKIMHGNCKHWLMFSEVWWSNREHIFMNNSGTYMNGSSTNVWTHDKFFLKTLCFWQIHGKISNHWLGGHHIIIWILFNLCHF